MPELLATPADFEMGRAALLDITGAETIGEPAGSIDEGDGVISVYFDTTMPGYKGWRWTVSIAHIDGGDPTVLETELTPGETALLSPAWVPWADRMADYEASQQDAGDESDGDGDDDDDDDFDDDVSDDDEALLHSGDLDGVDIDSLEEDDESDDADDPDYSDEESAAAVSVEQPDEADQESGDARPDQPQAKRRRKNQGND
ncbi:MAG: DUF3027 domain-containing protein [Homoserinimonas sp.]